MSSEETIDMDWQPVPSADPVERVARALCAHERRNPDLMVLSGRSAPVIADDGIAVMGHVEEPLWKEYAEEAERLVIAFQAFRSVKA